MLVDRMRPQAFDRQPAGRVRQSSGSSGAETVFAAPADFAPFDSEASLRMDALDGTAGVTGPRTWTGLLTVGSDAGFADTLRQTVIAIYECKRGLFCVRHHYQDSKR